MKRVTIIVDIKTPDVFQAGELLYMLGRLDRSVKKSPELLTGRFEDDVDTAKMVVTVESLQDGFTDNSYKV